MAEAWHGVTVIENDRNLGFGAAINQGLRRSGGLPGDVE